jgi:cephalosporin hydroxylase
MGTATENDRGQSPTVDSGLPSPISAIPRANLRDIQRATMRYTWRGVLCNKNPFDLALYPMLLWREKPATIIEIGSKEGGSALWLWQTCNAFHIKTRIVSIDINQRARIKHPYITFLQGDGRNLSTTLSENFLNGLSRPFLVIEDADHHYLTTIGVLHFMDQHLRAGEYILIEDGICDSFGNHERYDGGPNRAIAEFLNQRAGSYEVDRSYCDYFGHNVTWNTNGYIRRIG